jgi:Ala-tRNA(Pro) deacylase
MKTRDDLMAFLGSLRVETTTHDHPAVFRVEEGEAMKAAIPGAHTKNLFLKDASLSFGREELMVETLGVTPGSVTAFGLINDVDRRVRFVLDRTLAQADLVNFHPLTNTATTTIGRDGFAKFLAALGIEPMVVDFDAMQVVAAH